MHVARLRRKQQRGKDLLHDGSDSRKCQSGGAAAHALALDVRVSDRGQDDMMLPAGIAPSLEVVEPQFAFELLVLLLDGPALMRQGHQRAQRGGGGQMDEVVLQPRCRAPFVFAQQPDLRREMGMAPLVCRRDADRGEPRGSRRLRAIAPGDAPPARGRQLGRPVADRHRSDGRHHRRARAGTAASIGHSDPDARAGGEDRHLRRNTDGIRHAQSMQGRTKRRDIPELGIGKDGGQGQPRGSRLSQQAQGHPPLFLKANRGWNSRLLPRVGRQPLLGQIQGRAETPAPEAGPQRSGDRHLAIRDFAERATVLPGHADRRGALLRKAGAIEDQHASPLGQYGAQAPPDAIRIPWRMGDEVLKGLIRDRFGDARQHRLHRLAVAVAEHALHIRPQRQQLRAMAKAALELLQPSNQSLQARRRREIDQCAADYRIREKSTMSSNAITRDFAPEINDLTKSN